MTANSKGTRSRLLGGVGTAVLATILASSAHASPPPEMASTSISLPALPDTTPTVNATAHKSVDAVQQNVAPVGAVVSDVVGGIDGVTDPGTQVGNSNNVSTNTIKANATANTFTNSVDLSLINATTGVDPEIDPAAYGAASLGVQTNANSTVSSIVGANTLAITLPGFQNGAAANTDNAITAATTVNQGVSSIAGVVPNDYTSTATGSSTLAFPGSPGGDEFRAQGTVVVSSVQQSVDTAGSAVATDNGVTLDLTASANNTVTSGPVLDNNSVGATFKANSAQNTADLQSGGNPQFSGSAVVSNLQANLGPSEVDGVAVNSGTASNTGSSISATVYGSGPDAVNTLNGALSVSGNSITSTASGNDATSSKVGTAGNRILLGDGLSFAGAGTIAPGSSIAYNDGATGATAAADLVILNSQGNTGPSSADHQTLTSTTEAAAIGATVQSIDGGSIGVSDNSLTASVSGNAASSAIASGTGAQGFAGSAAVANQQINYNTDLAASVANGQIAVVTGADGGLTHGSTVSVTDNTSSATGYGNSMNQSIALDATALNIGNGQVALTGGTGPDGNVAAAGGSTVTNLQSGYNSALAVTNTNSLIGLDADSRGPVAPGTILVGDSLATTGNTQEAVAVGNSGSNGLSLTSNDVGSGAGIASAQILDGDSSVSASLTGAAAGVVASTHLQGGQIDVSNNLQRVIAYGGSASNTLNVRATDVSLAQTAGAASVINYDVGNPLAFSNTNQPIVSAAFGVLSDQSTQASVTATANTSTSPSPIGSGLGVSVEGAVIGSTVSNASNNFVAAAYGNDAANSATLAVDNIDSGDSGFASVAAVSNTQAAGAPGSTIAATATGGNVVFTGIQRDVTDSSVSTSGNAIQALAYGNRASGNTLTVAGANNIDTVSETPTTGVTAASGLAGDLGLTANASFAVQNAQSANGMIRASQLDDPIIPTVAAGVLTTVGGDVTNASLTSASNQSTASATANSAVNGVSIAGNRLATTSGVQNFQSNNAQISALIGLPGVPGTPASGGTDPVDFTFVATGSGIAGAYDSFNDVYTITFGTQVIDPVANGLTPDQVQAILNSGDGWTQSSPGADLTRSAIGRVVSSTVYGQLTEGSGATLPGVVPGTSPTPGTAATPNAGGVTLAVNGAIRGSQLSVNGNTAAGSAIGNNASNGLAVDATTIAGGSGLATSQAGQLDIVDGLTSGAAADHALSNLQTTDSAGIASSVYGTFAIDTVEGSSISGSTLSVSGNSQSATAVANTASNVLSLGNSAAGQANAISAGSALSSLQGSIAPVSASSDVELFAPAAVSASTVSLSNNSNSALAVINDVTNTSTVSANSVVPVGASGNAVLDAADGSAVLATGDHVVANQQQATASATSTASTTLYNQDSLATTGTGLNNSSLTISGNNTAAEASANRASNSLVLNGSALQSASGGVANNQQSSAAVTANASTDASVHLAGGNVDVPAAALNGSGVTIADNSTTALARGNAATNALNVTTGASYGASADVPASSTFGPGQNVQAQDAVLNSQVNNGAIYATSVNVTYGVALNAGAGSPLVSGSSVAVTGNQVASQAYGNSANNSLTVAALNTGTPTAAVGNYQLNTGAVTATATTVSFGFTGGTGTIGGSALRTTGNQISATAIGNSAVSSITGAR